MLLVFEEEGEAAAAAATTSRSHLMAEVLRALDLEQSQRNLSFIKVRSHLTILICLEMQDKVKWVFYLPLPFRDRVMV